MTFDEMIAFSCVKGGLSIDDFLELSWYEWGLLVDRVNYNFESKAFFVRDIMATILNTVRDSKKRPEPFKGKDFYKLSFDSEQSEEGTGLLTPDEVTKKFGTLKKKIDG